MQVLYNVDSFPVDISSNALLTGYLLTQVKCNVVELCTTPIEVVKQLSFIEHTTYEGNPYKNQDKLYECIFKRMNYNCGVQLK